MLLCNILQDERVDKLPPFAFAQSAGLLRDFFAIQHSAVQFDALLRHGDGVFTVVCELLQSWPRDFSTSFMTSVAVLLHCILQSKRFDKFHCLC